MSNPNYCSCCGRYIRKPKVIRTDQGETIVLEHEKLERQFKHRLEMETEAQRQKEREQRLIDRADYLHLIPIDQRHSSLSLADELRYKAYGLLERARKEQQSQNPGQSLSQSYEEQKPIDKPTSSASEATPNRGQCIEEC